MRVIHRGNRLGRDGRYHLDRQIGEDPLGSLWLAKDVSLGTQVTIRLLRSELVADVRFQRHLRAELRAAAKFEHPNVPGMITARGTPDGHVQYVVMRAFEGRPLASRLSAGRPLDAAAAERVASQVKAALDAAHAAGLVHGGLGPHSVFLTGRGVRVIDFGIVAALRQAARQTGGEPVGDAEGPPETLAPHEPVEADDDRSLERLRQEMLAGRPGATDELSTLVRLVAPSNGATKTTNGSPSNGHSPPKPVSRARPIARKPPRVDRRTRVRPIARKPPRVDRRTRVRSPFARAKALPAQAFRAVASGGRSIVGAAQSVARLPLRAFAAVGRASRSALRSAGRGPRRIAGGLARGVRTAVRSTGRAIAWVPVRVARGTVVATRAVARTTRATTSWFARRVGSAVRAVGRGSTRVGSSTAHGAGSAARSARRATAASGGSAVRKVGSVARSTQRGTAAAGRSIGHGTGSVARAARRVTAASGTMIGRAAGATARTAGRSARSAGRAIAAVGPRRLGLAAGAVVLVVAGSIALAGMLGSPERRPTNAAAPTETASPSPIAEEPPGPSPVQTSSPEPATTSGLVVPDVVGLSALEAMRLLESSGLEIGTAEPVPGPPGQVVDTSPRVAELVAPGTPVTLFVGTTPERLQPAS